MVCYVQCLGIGLCFQYEELFICQFYYVGHLITQQLSKIFKRLLKEYKEEIRKET